jgi:hypothetical protein
VDLILNLVADPLRRLRAPSVLFAVVLCGVNALAQVALPPPPLAATPVEKLAMEQVAELVRAEEYDEALASLQKLFDSSAGSLIARDAVRQHATMRSQHYVPLRQWCVDTTTEILHQKPILQNKYAQEIDGLAAAALAGLQTTKDPVEARDVVRRYRLSSSGDALTLLLADLYLERGWNIAAVAELERIAPELRYQPMSAEGAASAAKGDTESAKGATEPAKGDGPQGSRAWPSLWAQAATTESQADLLALWNSRFAEAPLGRKANLVEVLRRLLIAAAMQPEMLERVAINEWVSRISQEFSGEQAARLRASVEEVQAWDSPPTALGWKTFAATNSRFVGGEGRYDLSVWPLWQQQLEGYGTHSDRTSASKPRVGETERSALPYYPAIVDGKVYINELNRIRAYELSSGRPWPDVKPALPLFDSHIANAAYVPLGYPLVGVPRGTLAIDNGCLYARMGSPVTGWANRESASDGGSLSYLIGLDLSKQGSLLRGFPLRLLEPEFSQAEFEGCPMVLGEMLLVAIVERDNVGIRRSLAAFDRFSGELLWRSGVLAAGSVEGSDRANLITQQMLTYAGGRIYYNTNLGSIACLEPLTGETEWLVSYARFDKQKQTYPTPDRFRYRDLTPCLVAKGMVYCMPQDCAELFALDATTGEVLWSTDDLDVADAIHLLGVVDGSLIVSGDRLLWLDCRSGRLLGRFPASTTPGLVNALPSPRGLGRGVISDNEVYWPTAAEVFIFDADMSKLRNADAPPIKRRALIGTRGNAGGNLAVASGHLIFCGPSRVMAFEGTQP